MKFLSYLIPIINILISLLFWLLIQLEVKFSFGAGQSEYIFNKGLRLEGMTDVFITLLIVLNSAMIVIVFILNKKRSSL